MISNFIFYLAVVLFLSCVNGFQPSIQRKIQFGYKVASIDSTEERIPFENWSNPNYPTEQLNAWYLELDKALLTIGSKGISDTQINSLNELLKQHGRVRVKIASDRMDTRELSNKFASSEPLLSTAELLQVRRRGFMFAAKEFTPKVVKPWTPRFREGADSSTTAAPSPRGPRRTK
jgi:RNA-binding protein YhbY